MSGALLNPDPLRTVKGSRAWGRLQHGDERGAAQFVEPIRPVLRQALAMCSAGLKPAEVPTIVTVLAPALALCAPSGMTRNDRTEWIMAAADVLSDLPEDLLRQGVREAKCTADHPSKIVPAVRKSVSASLAKRRADRDHIARLLTLEAPSPSPSEDRIPAGDVDEANRLMRKFGCSTRWLPDGRHIQIDGDAIDPAQPKEY